MGNRLAMCLLLCCLWGITSAQIGGGIMAGINSCQVDGDLYGGYDKVGFHAGGLGFLKLSDAAYVQVEILGSLRGSRRIQDDVLLWNLNVWSIENPWLLRIRLKEFSTGSLFAHGGIGPDITLAAFKTDQSGIQLDIMEDIMARASIASHLGVDWYFSDSWSLTSRMSYTVGRIDNGINAIPWRHNVLSLGIRYLFDTD